MSAMHLQKSRSRSTRGIDTDPHGRGRCVSAARVTDDREVTVVLDYLVNEGLTEISNMGNDRLPD